MDPRYGAQAVLGMTSWVYQWFDPKRDDLEAFADAAVAIFLRPSAPTRTARPRRARENVPTASDSPASRVAKPTSGSAKARPKSAPISRPSR